MADMEYRGDSTAVSEITDAVLETYIPGGKYGIRLYNKQLIEAIGPVLGGNITTADQALANVQDTLIAAAGAQSVRAAAVVKRGKPAIRIESVAGESLGARVRATPACYTTPVRQGVASTAQVFRIIMPVGASGGTWKMTFGWMANVYDTVSLAYNVSEGTLAGEISSAANEVAGPGLTGVSVSVISNGSSTESRIYEVTMGGGFVGKNLTVVADGSTLQGTATVTAKTVQIAGEKATCIQSIWLNFLPNYNNGRQQVIKFSRGTLTSSEVSLEGTISQSAIEAAIAQVVGVNKVTVTMAINGENMAIVLIWNDLGDQSAVAATSYDKGTSQPGIPATCTTAIVRASGANQNEFLLASVGQGSTSLNGVPQTQPANYEVTQGATTWTITHSYSSTSANLVTQWESGVGSGNVSIYRLAKFYNMYLVEFKGAKSNLDQLPVTFTTPAGRSFTVVCHGEPLKNEIQSVVIKADGGTFTASSNGTNFTSALAYNLNAATFQTALRGLAAIGSGNCDVSGSGTDADPFLVEYVSGKAVTDMPLLVFNVGSLLGGYDPIITTVRGAVLGVSQITQIWLDPNLNSGYLIPIVNGVFDTRVAYNANAATWETAIESIPGAGCSVTGTGAPFIVTFDALGPKELTLNQEQAGVSVSSLITLENVQTATGPAFWNEPLNWSGTVVPGSGDRAILRDGNVNIREGLNQRCKFTVDLTTGNLIMGMDITDVGHFVPGQMVYLSTTGTLPTATSGGSGITLSASTGYYVTAVSQWSRRLQLSTTLGGQAIEFTGNGTGVHTVEVYLAEYQQHATFAGTVGLSRRINGRLEERPRYLSAGSALEQYGIGDAGSGSELQNRDLGSRVSLVKQFSTGSMGNEGEYSVNIRANNTGTNIWTGSGNLAISPSDMGTDKSIVGTIEANNSQILLGKVEIGGYQGLNTQLESPYGFTMRSNCTLVNKK